MGLFIVISSKVFFIKWKDILKKNLRKSVEESLEAMILRGYIPPPGTPMPTALAFFQVKGSSNSFPIVYKSTKEDHYENENPELDYIIKKTTKKTFFTSINPQNFSGGKSWKLIYLLEKLSLMSGFKM